MPLRTGWLRRRSNSKGGGHRVIGWVSLLGLVTVAALAEMWTGGARRVRAGLRRALLRATAEIHG
jgi:hypothetical protein